MAGGFGLMRRSLFGLLPFSTGYRPDLQTVFALRHYEKKATSATGFRRQAADRCPNFIPVA
jgi:hypothetical protein